MTTLFMQFDRFDRKITTLRDWRTKGHQPPVCKLWAAGKFSPEEDRLWDCDEELLAPKGHVTMELFFIDKAQVVSSDKFRPFWLVYLGEEEDYIETGAALSIEHLPWFMKMQDDCETGDLRLSCTARKGERSEDVKPLRGAPGDIFELFTYPQRLQLS